MWTEPATYETGIGPGWQARLSLARLLNQRLADMIDLFNQTIKQIPEGYTFLPSTTMLLFPNDTREVIKKHSIS
jgi:hypothetical protein